MLLLSVCESLLAKADTTPFARRGMPAHQFASRRLHVLRSPQQPVHDLPFSCLLLAACLFGAAGVGGATYGQGCADSALVAAAEETDLRRAPRREETTLPLISREDLHALEVLLCLLSAGSTCCLFPQTSSAPQLTPEVV